MSGGGQLAFGFAHLPSLGRDDFLISEANREAVAWLDSWPDWPSPALVIYGPVGSGKSHLGQAYRVRAGAIELTADHLRGSAFAELLGAAREVLIDDADRLDCDEALFHLYNALAARGGHIVLTAAQAPNHWAIGLADLRSRLLAAPAVALGRPDDLLVMAVLAKLFSDRQVRVDVDVVEYLARRMERSFTEAQRLVAEIDATALAEHRDVTVPFVREILQRRRDRQPG